MLVWSMRCGSVLLLGLIGIEGTRVFRKNCSVATIRVPWAGWPGRGAFVDDFGQRCGRGGLGSAVWGCSWWRNVGDAPGGATWAAGCLGQRDAVNGVGLA